MSLRGQKSGFGPSTFALLFLLLVSEKAAADPVLRVLIGAEGRQFGRDELLVRPDVATVTVTNDVAYRKSMSYRAVPLGGAVGWAQSCGR